MTDNTCYLIELTACFDTTRQGEERKSLCYAELGEYINSSTAYKCTMIAFQVGSCGFIDLNSFELLITYTHLKLKQATFSLVSRR